MSEFNIRDFLLGILVTALILIPLFFFFIIPNRVQDLEQDMAINRERIDAILLHQPEFFETTRYLGKMIEEFKVDMNERERLILTKDMPSEIIAEPSKED